MSELVTGEAVTLGLQPAKLPSRALAVTMDIGVYWGIYLALSFGLLMATASLDDAAAMAVSIALLLLILIGVPIAVETLTRGQSLGKLACGLRVVRDDGGPIRFRHALVRGAVGVIEIQLSLGVIACIASLVSARGRRLGDVFAGTLVVRERVPVQRTRMRLPLPQPWLAGQLAEIDLSGVPDGLWLAVRQYLSRMRQLDPQVSWSMGRQLAADVSARTGTPVPSETPPADFLAAVVAQRQAREAQKVCGAPPPGPGPAPTAWAAPGGAAPVHQPADAVRASGPERPAEPEPPKRATGFAPPA